MSFDAGFAAESLQRIERRIIDIRHCAQTMHTAAGERATIVDSLRGAHQALLSISELVVPLKRTVVMRDHLGPVASIGELALRAARLIVLTQGPRACALARAANLPAECTRVLSQRVFALERATHRITLLWANPRGGRPSNSTSRGQYRTAIDSAWRAWAGLRGDAELISALRRTACARLYDLQRASTTLLTVLHIQCFASADLAFVAGADSVCPNGHDAELQTPGVAMKECYAER